jgi:hypothetical protein
LAGCALPADVELSRCGVGVTDNRPLAIFRVEHARDVLDYFPAETRQAPELAVPEPATVVVFAGVVNLTDIGVGGKFVPGRSRGDGTRLERDVVCVLLPRTAAPYDIHVYYGVNLAGFSPPAN